MKSFKSKQSKGEKACKMTDNANFGSLPTKLLISPINSPPCRIKNSLKTSVAVLSPRIKHKEHVSSVLNNSDIKLKTSFKSNVMTTIDDSVLKFSYKNYVKDVQPSGNYKETYSGEVRNSKPSARR